MTAKPFAWSYSALKTFEGCPKKFYEINVAKNYKESSEQLAWGNEVHLALAKAIKTKTLLQGPMAPFNKWLLSIRKWPGEVFVEQKYALDRNLNPCEYFGPNVWYRGVGDVVGINGAVGIILDWKTGKPQIDSKQLMLEAQCIFSFHPDVNEVWSMFVWLNQGTFSKEVYSRASMPDEWLDIFPRAQRMEDAAKMMDYPPKHNALCRKHCPVTACPFHGKPLR